MDFGSDKIRFLNHKQFTLNRDLYHDTVLYQAGNNYELHQYMLPCMHAYGGIVELHDVNLGGVYSMLIERLVAHAKRLQLLSCITMVCMYPELRFFLWYKFLKPLYDKQQYLDRHMYRKSLLVRKERLIIVRDEFPVRYFRLPSRKCRIITYGIGIKDLPDDSQKSAIRKRFKITHDAFVLVSAGIINSIKKIAWLYNNRDYLLRGARAPGSTR